MGIQTKQIIINYLRALRVFMVYFLQNFFYRPETASMNGRCTMLN